QYGSLDLNYTNPMNGDNVGSGVSDDLGMGFDIGTYFDVNKDLTVALAYQSAIEMEYDGQMTTAADGFGIGPNGMDMISSDKLEQPAQLKLGVAYTMNNWLLTADAKQIKWGSASGYKDFGWDDQNVFGLGAKFSGNGFWAGFGYNYGEDPIEVLPNVAGDPMGTYANQAINMFNNHFFPAIVESHYTVGAGYELNKTMTIEGAIVYAPEVDKTIDTSAITGMLVGMDSTHEVTHSQTGVTVSLRMNF
ncbi:MAG TPA: outer membrane protein transport protein, partial [Marinobacter sp.]